MKAKKLLKTKNIKDTLFRDGNWITGGLSELMNEFANQQKKELIEAFFKYLCNDADVIVEAFEDFDPDNVNNIIQNFFFELKTPKK